MCHLNEKPKSNTFHNVLLFIISSILEIKVNGKIDII
jgi:hypothetical protein